MLRAIAIVSALLMAGLIAAYVALAPLAPIAPAGFPLHALILLDDVAARTAAIGGRSAAVAAIAAAGAGLAALAAFTGRKPNAPKAPPANEAAQAPRPAWRPEPYAPEDRIAGLRRRALGEAAVAGTSPSAPSAVAPSAVAPPPLVLIRKLRERERDWFADHSWLGGLPRLGGAPWPHDDDGIPLPFAAQIDLAEIAACIPETPLPRTGSLAFFLGRGAVVPVPEGVHAFSEPPAGLPPAFEEGAGPLPSLPGRLSRPFFPFWPVSPVMQAGLHGDTVPRSHPFDADGTVLWWHSVNHLCDRLHVASAEAFKLLPPPGDSAPSMDQAVLAEQRGGMADVLAAMLDFAAARDPWQRLTADEHGVVTDLLAELHTAYREIAGRYIPRTEGALEAISLRAMITGAPDALAAVPPDQLDRINRAFRLPMQHHHRMFGESETADDVLLLQLSCDDMMEWGWPDGNVFRFHIGAAAAAQRDWSAARLTSHPA